MKQIKIKVYPEINNTFDIILIVDEAKDIDEQIDAFIDDHLINVQSYEILEQ